MATRVGARRKWYRVARIAIPVLAIAGIGTYSYLQHGLTLRTLYPVAIFLVSFLYHFFGPSRMCQVNYLLLFPTGYCLWTSFLLWDPSEHLPFGSDMEYPYSAALAFGTVVGMTVLLAKAIVDEDADVTPTWTQYLVLLSTVAVAGYAMFLPYAFAMYQILVEGNHIFALLAVFSVVAFLAFAHSRVPHEQCGQES
ncbi:MAG: hypothetical protein OYI31_01875 [Chloroflexota bacterium]|nr:hypothetical protein [Chloroflexota bacterium]MDE2941221.1 hypothetical protein [Chloroflexota bacterium]MDE3267195.1 hypothetical protein [Chloroflexota bacterium]